MATSSPKPSNPLALVTGASRGIGRAIALELAKQGAFVAGTATTEAGAAAIQQCLDEADAPGVGLVLDVADSASVKAALEALAPKGTVTILVNNAGITCDGLLLRMKDDDWQRVLDTNLSGAYRMSKAVLRGMMGVRWGRIVNIASVVAATGNLGQANYVAAKAGLVGFTKSLAQEVGSRNITVNAIAPGFIDTDMTRALKDDQRDALLARVPLQRWGTPSEVAAAVGFLVSEAAGYITGETLHINGGLYMA
ncbi:MAG: 3-oxoacyl-ACP reductase FabG [Candidatus Competibacterales bacterium]